MERKNNVMKSDPPRTVTKEDRREKTMERERESRCQWITCLVLMTIVIREEAAMDHGYATQVEMD